MYAEDRWCWVGRNYWALFVYSMHTKHVTIFRANTSPFRPANFINFLNRNIWKWYRANERKIRNELHVIRTIEKSCCLIDTLFMSSFQLSRQIRFQCPAIERNWILLIDIWRKQIKIQNDLRQIIRDLRQWRLFFTSFFISGDVVRIPNVLKRHLLCRNR